MITARLDRRRRGRPPFHRGWRHCGMVAGALALVLLGSGAVEAAPVPIPQQFLAQGLAEMTISGPSCCDGYRFQGVFEAAFDVDPGGTITIHRLRTELFPIDIGHVGVFGLATVPLRCAEAINDGPIVGAVSGTAITLPAGGASLLATSFATQAADGSCTEQNLGLDALNPASIVGTHDPAGNRFSLTSTFAATVEGGTYSIGVALEGVYVNRPPMARLGLVLPGLEQGGCPAVWHEGNPPEWRIEANHPQGLKAPLRSFSNDPDTALAPRADLAHEVWTHAQDGGAEVYLGTGPDLGDRTFAYGPVHRVRLLAADQLGGQAIDECTFRVVDTTPPVVMPPPAMAVRCSQHWGATPASSAELAAFLGAAGATDAGDGSPVALPARVGGVEVTPSTPFWLDAWVGAVPVELRFRDAAGNVGTAASSVAVYDDQPPSLTVALSPAVTSANSGVFVAVSADLTVSDNCSPVWVWLESIASNAPGYDGTDVVDAAFDTDDRGFSLRARPAGPAADRIYTVTYRAIDLYGHGAVATATFTVKYK